MSSRRGLLAMSAAVIAGVLAAAPRAQSPADRDPTPASAAEFRRAAWRVLEETGVPGAGIALVRADGVEWAGGIGWADRDARVPVDDRTLFRAGSISKTFVALALVRLYERGWLHVEDPVSAHIPELRIDNPWDDTDPVRIAHLLEHTAGFDDMRFNEVYNLRDPPDLPLADVLARNPQTRRVRWRPGTRVAYSNPGYAVAGYLVERVSGRPFEHFIAEEIFAPLGMHDSSFRLTPDVASRLARGYRDRTGPPVPVRHIYLRPAGNLHTSARDLGRFVQMLLNWGALGPTEIVDPEYLNRMEYPRTSMAARAGLRDGYGSGIAATLTLPYKVLGHDGSIDGFLSSYGYSPARDAGFVVLLNSSASPEALTRLSSLAIRYLKREVAPPQLPPFPIGAADLARFTGYYQSASPRYELLALAEWLTRGYTVALAGDHLVLRPLLGPAEPLVPVSEITFRRPHEVDASLVFAPGESGRPLLLGASLYAEQRPRAPALLARAAVAGAFAVAASPLLAAVLWGARWLAGRRRAPGRALRGCLVAAAAALAALPVVAGTADVVALAEPNAVSGALFLLTLLQPLLALVLAALAVQAWWAGASRGLAVYALIATASHLVVAALLGSWGLIGLRTWAY